MESHAALQADAERAAEAAPLDEMGTSPDDVEYGHYMEIMRSFRDYPNWMAAEARRREAHLAQLPPKWKALLPASSFAPKADALRSAIDANAAFLASVADEQEASGFGRQFAHRERTCGACGHGHGGGEPHDHDAPPSGAAAPLPTSSPAHYSKVKSTLHQLVRDWSAEGAPEREACYGPILAELAKELPVTRGNANAQRVLVPGCGTARLLHDLVAAGYAAQGNEFSLQMLFTSHVVLNVLQAPGCVTLHPFIHDASNHLRPDDMLRGVAIPDAVPSALGERNPGADMSMTAGAWGGVVGVCLHAGGRSDAS